jgi:predicted transcriptional regulator
MKTTIELPDDLVRQVRDVARESGVTMRELVVEGLRSELARRATPTPTVDFVFTAVEGQGLADDVAAGEAIAASYETPR